MHARDAAPLCEAAGLCHPEVFITPFGEQMQSLQESLQKPFLLFRAGLHFAEEKDCESNALNWLKG